MVSFSGILSLVNAALALRFHSREGNGKGRGNLVLREEERRRCCGAEREWMERREGLWRRAGETVGDGGAGIRILVHTERNSLRYCLVMMARMSKEATSRGRARWPPSSLQPPLFFVARADQDTP